MVHNQVLLIRPLNWVGNGPWPPWRQIRLLLTTVHVYKLYLLTYSKLPLNR